MSSVPESTGVGVMESTAYHQQRIAAAALRAKELEAHGQLTCQLQMQLDSHRCNEKELQLTIAKVRAEKCRTEAECAALRTKYQSVEYESVGRAQRHENLVEDFRQRLLAKQEEIETLKQQIHGLTVETAEAAVKLAEKTAREAAQDLRIQRITNERDDAKQTLLSNTYEIARLTAELSKKQSEIELACSKSTELLSQFEERKNEVWQANNRACEVSRSIERLEISRLRLAGWKQSRWAIQRRDLLLQTVFLGWKSEMLASKAVQTHQAKHAATRRLQRVNEVHFKLSHRLMATKTALQTTKTWLETQQRDLCDWTELCTSQFANLVTSRLKDQQALVSQQHNDVTQALQQELVKKDHQHAQAMRDGEETAQTLKLVHKARMAALVRHIQGLYQQKLRCLAFQGWKDVYLRNVVAQTTHAVMVARAAASLATASRSPRSGHAGVLLQPTVRSNRGSPKVSIAELRQPKLTIDPFAREAEEDQWKRWRRVTPTEKIAKQNEVGSRRSSITSVGSQASTNVSTPTSHKAAASESTAIRREAAVDSPGGATARRRASIV